MGREGASKPGTKRLICTTSESPPFTRDKGDFAAALRHARELLTLFARRGYRRASNWPRVCFENTFSSIKLSAVKTSAIDSAFERALSAEIAASELLRMRVLAATLAVLLVAEQLLFLFARDLVEQITQNPLPAWLPAQIIGPFLAYEIVALLVLHYRLARGSTFPTVARFANALIETSLPTVSLWGQ